jgi:ketosteroid isomerase-like protein
LPSAPLLHVYQGPGPAGEATGDWEVVMGQAREIMDRITDAVMSGDGDALLRLYAADAVAETPDEKLEGNAAIADWHAAFRRAFPDGNWESKAKYEAGGTAIDEGYVVGTHTGTLRTPEGDLPPTGRSLRLRECDVVTVVDGVAVTHRFYYDRLEFTSQLGLVGSGTSPGAAPQPRAGAERSSEAAAR